VTTKSVVTDVLESLLDLVLETAGPGEVAIGNGGGDATHPETEWYVMCYWMPNNGYDGDGGDWEIFVEAPSLRAALCQVIAHPRFGQ
jgi:hypothetical protein